MTQRHKQNNTNENRTTKKNKEKASCFGIPETLCFMIVTFTEYFHLYFRTVNRTTTIEVYTVYSGLSFQIYTVSMFTYSIRNSRFDNQFSEPLTKTELSIKRPE